MKRCTALRPSSSRAAGLGCQVLRWISYDKASLTKESLLRKVEAGLGQDADGNPMRIDPESKTVSTAAGDLPISPIFDPAWMKARRQQRKADPGPPLGRFRRKLVNNPYARALSTPIRRCPNTPISLPRYFLQDFELVKHPTTGVAWWAPGALSFEYVHLPERPDKPKKTDGDDLSEAAEEEETSTSTSTSVFASTSDATTPTVPEAAAAAAAATATTTTTTTTTTETSTEDLKPRPRRGPVVSYTLCRKSIVDMMGGPNKKYVSRLLAVRNGMAMTPDTTNTVWRQDMGDAVLRMMRQHAVDALITRGNRTQEPKDRFVQPCGSSWDAVKDVRLRGCVLWLPREQDQDQGREREQAQEVRDAAAGAGGQHQQKQYAATLDVDGFRYGSKIAVHNLVWLLGEEEAQRLRGASEVFRKNEILVLKQWHSYSMMSLHLLLWRLQGYLGASE